MDYKQAIQYIEELYLSEQKRPSAPSLRRMQAFLALYDFPQDSFTAFHIAGTNGKGSTTAMLASMLMGSNKKIGRFAGPHILSYNERFEIDGQVISDHQFALLTYELKEKSENFAKLHPDLGLLSWFEFLTAISFFFFAQSKIDIAVIEVGLGGRFDATNVLNKLYATAITNISLDHQKILGHTLEQIAFEKAGIIKPRIPIVSAATEPALQVIKERASEMQAPLILSSEQELKQIEKYAYPLDLISKRQSKIIQHGLHQYQNALTAMSMLIESDIVTSEPKALRDTPNKKLAIEDALKGLDNFSWPGRFQFIESKHMILDGAHNPAGIVSLRQSLDYLFACRHCHFIFACFEDKDGLMMLSNLLKPGDKLYLPSLAAKRPFYDPALLSSHAATLGTKVNLYPDVQSAIVSAKEQRKTNELIVAAGSFYLLREVMKTLEWCEVI